MRRTIDRWFYFNMLYNKKSKNVDGDLENILVSVDFQRIINCKTLNN